jgi:hypothetical protein
MMSIDERIAHRISGSSKNDRDIGHRCVYKGQAFGTELFGQTLVWILRLHFLLGEDRREMMFVHWFWMMRMNGMLMN